MPLQRSTPLALLLPLLTSAQASLAPAPHMWNSTHMQ
eukprot:CAMPEP_0202923688 /NCGR_PEP_ID=MMETSP1392-20130828/78581_1 /ASSEMBLY_ACC=CAM_ASM_000868 /TAXON_ID=225041 /ORGANISM="Chlamydomonas chlamydogama, Strain SAG 11-48b" /LENGTH=36 /DNA_ID= /DNA_START= /DNA_END= /DNA_ORIENTATION=